MYGFFWVIPWRLNFICRRFGTLCLFHLHRQVGNLLAYERGTEGSETSACKIQTPGNYPEESIQHTERGESLKSRTWCLIGKCFDTLNGKYTNLVKMATINDVTYEGVVEFVYLGTLISNDNSVQKDNTNTLSWPAIELILQL